jgi:hypothetical protein
VGKWRFFFLLAVAALQIAMLMGMRCAVFQLKVCAFAAAGRRKMLSLYARHFERVLTVIVNDGVNARDLYDLAGFVGIIACHMSFSFGWFCSQSKRRSDASKVISVPFWAMA